MNQDFLQQLTKLCGAELPSEYVDLLAEYPAELASAVRAIDDSDTQGTVAQAELLRSFECVVALNIEVRDEPLMRPDGLEMLWPEQFAVIGETGAGDYFCIDVLREIEGVMQYDHQAVEFFECADSLQEFVEMLLETFAAEGDDDDPVNPSDDNHADT